MNANLEAAIDRAETASDNLQSARYGKHSIHSALVRAKREGNLTDELRRNIIDTRKHVGKGQR